MEKSGKYLIAERTFDFALSILHLQRKLVKIGDKVLAHQLLKSGTSIGANVAEAGGAESKTDFLHKISISNKEARETKYWLNLIDQSDLYSLEVNTYLSEINNIINIISKIIINTKQNLK